MYDIIYMNINIYMYIHVNIFKIYAVCVCLLNKNFMNATNHD